MTACCRIETRSAAMPAMRMPMLIEAVAAGDGALSTWMVLPAPRMQKSSSRGISSLNSATTTFSAFPFAFEFR
ncbi:MAG: hypothetical protein PVG78_17485 [Desulfobacterales bacterium]|jgi:hypothetical protein